MKAIVRKEVHLPESVIKTLLKKAKYQKISVKKLMEDIISAEVEKSKQIPIK